MTRASPELQAFYRAAQRQEEPKRGDRRVVRAGLLSAGAFSAAANAGATPGSLAALIPAGAKLLGVTQIVGYVALGAALGAGAAVAGFATRTAPVASASANVVSGSSAPSAPRELPVRAAVPEPTSAPEPTAAALPATAPTPQTMTARRPHAATQPSAPSAPSLTQESRALAEVQAALGAHDARKALQLLATQDRLFAAGALGQERSAARVFALCKAGRTSEAEAAKTTFLSRYPESPLAKRVGAACEK